MAWILCLREPLELRTVTAERLVPTALLTHELVASHVLSELSGSCARASSQGQLTSS
jgi:hypothetical protein